MTKKYKQLSQEERDRIFLLKQQGKSNTDIAKILGRDKSTIGRELKRNRHRKFNQYLPDTAQRKTDKRKKKGRKKNYLDKDNRLKEYVLFKLKIGWSPELIAGKMNDEIQRFYNSESIYQYIYSLAGRKENLRMYLRRAHRIRRKKNGRKHHKGKIPNRLDIALRPKITENRRQFGHWEGDSMFYQGHSQNLSTQTERKSRYTILLKPKDKSAEERAKILSNYFRKLSPEAKRTMTFDNGMEFANHEDIARKTEMKIYFAKPYSSWQRGTNENRNGLVRWFLPKDTNLNSLTEGDLKTIQDLINNRPMKCLNFQTPTEVFNFEMNRIKQKSNQRSKLQTKFFYPQVALAN
ncbi:IS30 family transposase [Candidatus Wolfebacteria bacterium]|nr:IS30 family transposase [Candidatus Wolfebacteria bacterium]